MAVVVEDEARENEGETVTATDLARRWREREFDLFLAAMDGVFAAVLRPETRTDN
ncbi:MAG TPA: hypothetical protein VIK51_01165 [Vicinamibacteria bacterium]|jgi:hypothetical protein